MNDLLLVADAASGITITDFLEYPEAEIMHVGDFIKDCSHLSVGEQIFAMIMPAGTDGVFEAIDEEYGIRV